MELICEHEAIFEGKKVMQFTKGKTYTFEEIGDPEGWAVDDDNGRREIFFDPYGMFKKVK